MCRQPIELADQFDSHGQAKRELSDYLEAFYNTQRRHATLGRVRPAEFEPRFLFGAGTEQCA